MRVAVIFSGGKDSCYALFKAGKKDDIKCLISLKPENDSYMFHYPNIELVKVQARLMDIPLIFKKTNNKNEIEDLKKCLKEAIKKYKIEGLYSGALASNFQREKIKKICDELKLESINPLWNIDGEKYIKELIDNKFKIIITGIAAEGLTKEFLGRIIDYEILEKLKKIKDKYKINIHGEGGEYETFVLDCPMFKEEIKIEKSQIKMENECTGRYVILKNNVC